MYRSTHETKLQTNAIIVVVATVTAMQDTLVGNAIQMAIPPGRYTLHLPPAGSSTLSQLNQRMRLQSPMHGIWGTNLWCHPMTVSSYV